MICRDLRQDTLHRIEFLQEKIAIETDPSKKAVLEAEAGQLQDALALDHKSDLFLLLTGDPIRQMTSAWIDGPNRIFLLDRLQPGFESRACVQQFKSSLPGSLQTELNSLEDDLVRADSNGDGILVPGEMNAFARRNPDRWPDLALFRSAAGLYLNTLPDYLSQPDPNAQGLAHLRGILNDYSRLWGVSSDLSQPSDFIIRASHRALNPAEWVEAKSLSSLKSGEDGKLVYDGTAPFMPEELATIEALLDQAAKRGDLYYGMVLLTKEEAGQILADQEAAALQCGTGIAQATAADNIAALRTAFGQCRNTLGPLQSKHAGVLSVADLVRAAREGTLSPDERNILRTWVKEKMPATTALNDVSALLDPLWKGVTQMVGGIAQDPIGFIAQNLRYIVAAVALRNVVRGTLFENRLEAICGGAIPKAQEARKVYDLFVNQFWNNATGWKRVMHKGLTNLFFELGVFTFVAGQVEDTGILGDLAIAALFQGMSNLGGPSLRKFVDQKGLCRSSAKTEEEKVTELPYLESYLSKFAGRATVVEEVSGIPAEGDALLPVDEYGNPIRSGNAENVGTPLIFNPMGLGVGLVVELIGAGSAAAAPAAAAAY